MIIRQKCAFTREDYKMRLFHEIFLHRDLAFICKLSKANHLSLCLASWLPSLHKMGVKPKRRNRGRPTAISHTEK